MSNVGDDDVRHQLTKQQKLLVKQLDANTQVVHEFKLQYPIPPNQSDTASDNINDLETLLQSLKQELSTINKNHSIAGTIASLKNHLTSLVDLAMTAVRTDIKNDISQLGSKSPPNDPKINLDILDELKTLSTKVDTMHKKLSLPPRQRMRVIIRDGG